MMVVDKPAGWTSHDVVAKMRLILRERSIGHLGTLDPMATGVLPLVIGKMTRLSQFYGDSKRPTKGRSGSVSRPIPMTPMEIQSDPLRIFK